MAAEAKQVDLEDSNIANYGSKEHKELRKTAAESELEYKGAGAAPGLEIWRIENFGIKKWPKIQYGTFYQGDSYIILNTYKDPESDKLKYNVHFWLGKDTSQDEYGTAAYYTVVLDDLLNDAPVQYREVQGYESPQFRQLFPRMNILSGGIDSAFNVVKPTQYQPRLLHVKGKSFVTVVQVPLKAKSLNAGDCFILDAGLEIWGWNGPSSNHFERRKTTETINLLKDQRNGKPVSKYIDGLENDDKFWKLLGGKPDQIPPATPDVDIFPHERKLMRLSDSTGQLVFSQVAASAGEFKRELLDPNDVSIVDIGHTIFVWIGHGASPQEKKKAMEYANNYLIQNDRPAATPVLRVLEGSEPPSFLEAFKPAAAPAAASSGDDEKKEEKAQFDGVLKIQVHEAKGLKDVQILGKQDPYCVVRVGKEKKQTKVHDDGGTSAVWKESFVMTINPDATDVRFVVRDKNIFVDADIGMAMLSLSELTATHADPRHNVWLALVKDGEPAGSVCVSIRYFPPMIIEVPGCRDLHDVQVFGKQDPYVKVSLGHVTAKSAVHENGNKNPQWANNMFRFNAVLFEGVGSDGHTLELLSTMLFEVKNHNIVKDDLIAALQIELATLRRHLKGQPKWYPLVRPDQKPSGEICVIVHNPDDFIHL